MFSDKWSAQLWGSHCRNHISDRRLCCRLQTAEAGCAVDVAAHTFMLAKCVEARKKQGHLLPVPVTIPIPMPLPHPPPPAPLSFAPLQRGSGCSATYCCCCRNLLERWANLFLVVVQRWNCDVVFGGWKLKAIRFPNFPDFTSKRHRRRALCGSPELWDQRYSDAGDRVPPSGHRSLVDYRMVGYLPVP